MTAKTLLATLGLAGGRPAGRLPRPRLRDPAHPRPWVRHAHW